MVDTPSLIIGIIAIVIALIAIVFVFIRKGNQGVQGNIGLNGNIGPTGPDGDIPGINGPKGPTGPAFSSGETGQEGPKGKTGPKGPNGPIGDKGPVGPPGGQGPQGGIYKSLIFNLDPSNNPNSINIGDINNYFFTLEKNKSGSSNTIVVLGDFADPINYGTSFIFNNKTDENIQYCTTCSRGSNACNKDGKCPPGENPFFLNSDGTAFSKIILSGNSYLHTLVNKGGNSVIYRSVSKLDFYNK